MPFSIDTLSEGSPAMVQARTLTGSCRVWMSPGWGEAGTEASARALPHSNSSACLQGEGVGGGTEACRFVGCACSVSANLPYCHEPMMHHGFIRELLVAGGAGSKVIAYLYAGVKGPE